MTDEFELRTTSDAFLARVERLHRLEERKRTFTPGTPDMVRITREVEKLTAEVHQYARRQTELAELAGKRRASRMRPIVLVPPRDIDQILAEWREAERSVSAATPGTAEWESAIADVERLRNEYGRAHAARSADRTDH